MRPWVSERVLVLERIHGKKVAEGHGLERGHAAALARELFRAYVQQVTLWGVYHADPHRGNVLITDDGRLALLDFGLIGRLSDDVRRRLGLLLLALAHNRADDVADLLLSLSLVTGDSDVPGFFHEVRRKLPCYHWRPLAGIATGAALRDLQRIALRYRILLPTSFALVGKTLGAGGVDRPHARPTARPGRPRRGGRAQCHRRRRRPLARAKPGRRERIHADRGTRAGAPSGRRDRVEARDRHAQGRRCAERPGRPRPRVALDGEPRRCFAHRRRPARRVGADRSGERRSRWPHSACLQRSPST